MRALPCTKSALLKITYQRNVQNLAIINKRIIKKPKALAPRPYGDGKISLLLYLPALIPFCVS